MTRQQENPGASQQPADREGIYESRIAQATADQKYQCEQDNGYRKQAKREFPVWRWRNP
jgi:hypothetical protein